MKRRIVTALLISMTMAVSASACGTEGTGGAGSTVTAESSAEEAGGGEITSEAAEAGEKAAGAESGKGTGEVQAPAENSEGEAPGSGAPADGQTPPEASNGEGPADGQTPPEAPNGGAPADGQTPPAMPNGGKPDGKGPKGGPGGRKGQGGPNGQNGPGGPGGQNGQGGPNGQNGPGGPGGQNGQGGPNGQNGQGGPGGSQEVTQGEAAANLTEDASLSGETYTSSGDDENALRVTGAKVTLDKITVEKTGGSSSNVESGDFYGMNAGLLATDGADVTITNATVNTSAQNGNGVFSYGNGTTVTISDSTITTTADNSGGIQTTGGGTMNASNLTVETSGNSAAAIRSDRGGGTVTVDGGTYTSSGYNSPAVYSTAAITVNDAKLTANNSEALVIEGKNSITLNNADVTGNMSDDKGASSDVNVHNVMIYQSMSGDAEEGTSSFRMTGGALTSKNGDQFYVTNTACTIDLSGVSIKNEDADANFMTVTGNDASHGWGTAGANGGSVVFTADGQTFEGSIVVDTISTLDMTLKGNSTFTGTVNIVDNAEGGTAVDSNAVIVVEEGSTWNLTGDCKVTSVTCSGTINYNGHTITLADGTVMQ